MAFNEQNAIEHFIIHPLQQRTTLKVLKQKLLNEIGVKDYFCKQRN